MAIQAACRGGSFAVESVAAFAWNGWQASSGISGNLGLEYAIWSIYLAFHELARPLSAFFCCRLLNKSEYSRQGLPRARRFQTSHWPFTQYGWRSIFQAPIYSVLELAMGG